MLEHYHWAFQKGISLKVRIDVKFVKMCYAILNYTVKLLVHHPLRVHNIHVSDIGVLDQLSFVSCRLTSLQFHSISYIAITMGVADETSSLTIQNPISYHPAGLWTLRCSNILHMSIPACYVWDLFLHDKWGVYSCMLSVGSVHVCYVGVCSCMLSVGSIPAC